VHATVLVVGREKFVFLSSCKATSSTSTSSVRKKNLTKILAVDPVCESEVTHMLNEAVLCHFVRMLY
jgi:hypothetical protein